MSDDEQTKLVGMILGLIITIPLLFLLCSRREECMERECSPGNAPRYVREGCLCVEIAK